MAAALDQIFLPSPTPIRVSSQQTRTVSTTSSSTTSLSLMMSSVTSSLTQSYNGTSFPSTVPLATSHRITTTIPTISATTWNFVAPKSSASFAYSSTGIPYVSTSSARPLAAAPIPSSVTDALSTAIIASVGSPSHSVTSSSMTSVPTSGTLLLSSRSTSLTSPSTSVMTTRTNSVTSPSLVLIPQDDPLQFPDSSAAEQSAKKLGTDGFAAVLMAPTAPSPGASPSPQINQLRYGSNERVSVESMFLYYGLPFGILIVMLGIVALRYQAVRRKKRLLKQRAEVTVQNEAFKSASALDAA